MSVFGLVGLVADSFLTSKVAFLPNNNNDEYVCMYTLYSTDSSLIIVLVLNT